MPAHEQIRLFKQRGFNGLIAATTENLKCGLTEMIPKPHHHREEDRRFPQVLSLPYALCCSLSKLNLGTPVPVTALL